jgi:hypothetical protein
MPNFPALSPGSRVFSPGSYAQAAYQSAAGQRTNVGHSNAMLSSRIELGFEALSAAEMQLIFQHYHGQQGGFLPFQVPADVFAGFPQLRVGTGLGGADGRILDATYSQSSVYEDNTAATAAGMTNGQYTEASQTGTDSEDLAWVQMDLGSVQLLTKVVVGCDFDDELPGGWGASYTEDKDVQGSIDGVTWVTLFNTGSFDDPIQEYPVDVAARYVRIVSVDDYLAVTEFYACTAPTFSDHRWRYSSSPQVEEIPTDPTNGAIYSVRVTLETAPAGGAIVAGTALGLAISLASGAATASSSVSGAALTVTLSLAAGAATANSSATGAALTLTMSLEAGAASGS